MSDNYNSGPYSQRNPNHRQVGILAGWDKITTQQVDGATPTGDHQFTAADLLKVVKAFREEFSVARLDEIEELIRRHMARTDNPHKLDLTDLDTSVLQELYNLWLSLGNEGSREDFMKVIFQYVKIADIATTRQGTAYDEVVSAKGLNTVVNDHDTNPDAHEALWRKLFPGAMVRTSPSFALEAYIGLPEDAVVTRDSSLWVLSAMGTMKKIPPHTLEADHSTGESSFPIFGAMTNYIEESENFLNEGLYYCKYAKITRSEAALSLDESASASYVLTEAANPTPVRHEIRYMGESMNIVEGEYYTISVFVHPMGRDSFGIEVLDIIDGVGRFGFHGSNLLPFDQGTFRQPTAAMYRNVHFNCATEEVFINDKANDLTGYIYPLYNGWYRLQVTFRALTSTPLSVSLYSLDIHDGDDTHEGIDGVGMAIFGLMVTDGPFLPPYIPSRNKILGSIAGTTVELPVGPWFNNRYGTIVAEATNQAIDAQLKSPCELYNIATGLQNIAAVARYPVGHQNRAYLIGYDRNNATVSSSWTNAQKRTWIQTIHAFSPTENLFAATAEDPKVKNTSKVLNPNCATLYLGCSRYLTNHFNGYVRSFKFYPEMITPESVHFFFGE